MSRTLEASLKDLANRQPELRMHLVPLLREASIPGPFVFHFREVRGVISASKIIQHIDRNSYGHLDLGSLKQKVFNTAKFWGLKELNPRTLILIDMGHDTDRPYTDVPIVVDERGEVIDGRHRVAQAIAEGHSRIMAYVPVQDPPTKI